MSGATIFITFTDKSGIYKRHVLYQESKVYIQNVKKTQTYDNVSIVT